MLEDLSTTQAWKDLIQAGDQLLLHHAFTTFSKGHMILALSEYPPKFARHSLSSFTIVGHSCEHPLKLLPNSTESSNIVTNTSDSAFFQMTHDSLDKNETSTPIWNAFQFISSSEEE